MAVKVRYTGARSGHAAVVIPGYGYFEPGTEVELEKEEAARWVQPAEDGKADWELVEKRGTSRGEEGKG